MAASAAIPREFIWRRIHSLMGFWLVLFLVEHLITNSQAALWLGDNGQGFVRMVDFLHNLPYLQVLECVLIGVPLLLHMIWGIQYLFTAKPNSSRSDGSRPSLPQYTRNRAYTWQRITSWILLVGIIGHVAKFRFLDYPSSVHVGGRDVYFVQVNMDDGLYSVAARLGVMLYGAEEIVYQEKAFEERREEKALLEAAEQMKEERLDIIEGVSKAPFQRQKQVILDAAQNYQEKAKWLSAVSSYQIKPGEVVAETTNFGTAVLLSVRDTFKSPVYVVLYTIFVMAACYHACNGFWTFLITWGWVLRRSAQKSMVSFAYAFMALLLLLGLCSIWGTFWLNLRH